MENCHWLAFWSRGVVYEMDTIAVHGSLPECSTESETGGSEVTCARVIKTSAVDLKKYLNSNRHTC